MRLAVIQQRLDRACRAANLTRLGQTIARAADHDPPPDLIVLPGRCDAARTDHRAVEVCLKETIAFRAREWGVFVAVGLSRGSMPCAVLFDADGDVVADTSPGDDKKRTAARMAFYASKQGRIGLLDGLRMSDLDFGSADAGGFAVVCVPVFLNDDVNRAEAQDVAARIRESASGVCGVALAVAYPAGEDTDRSDGRSFASFVQGANGVILAEAEDQGETILFADLPGDDSPAAVRSEASPTRHKRGGC